MLTTFNCGLGMVLAVPAASVPKALATIAQAGLPATVVGEVIGLEPGARLVRYKGELAPVRSYDLIGCGALNLDLIYRLPDDSPLWRELPPAGRRAGPRRPSCARASTRRWPASSRRAAAADRRPTPRSRWRAWASAPPCWAASAPTTPAAFLRPSSPRATPATSRSTASRAACTCCLNEAGERRNLVWPAANDDFSATDLPRRLPAARFAYFSSFVGERPLATQLALLERLPADVEIAFDPGEIYARLGVKCFIPFLKRTSYVFATERELETLCGLTADKALSFLLDVGVGLVVCKMGDRGAQIIGRRLDLYVPPHPAEVVDVTGAGDLFAAGFLAGLLEDVGLDAAGRLAAWAASCGITGVGRSAYPDAPISGATVWPRNRARRAHGSRTTRAAGRSRRPHATKGLGDEDRLALDGTRPGGL